MHYGLLMMEFIRQATRGINKNIYNLDNQTLKVLKYDKGIILMTAHLGNWEIILPIISLYKKMMVVVREQNNNGGDKFFNKARNFKNITLISKKGSKKAMVKSLLNNSVLGLASDQNAKDKGVLINIFNKPASIPKGAGHFYSMTKSKIAVGFSILNKKLNYDFKLRFIQLEDNIEQKDQLIVKINEIYSRMLEIEIKKYPEQYFWFHKKWDKAIYDL